MYYSLDCYISLVHMERIDEMSSILPKNVIWLKVNGEQLLVRKKKWIDGSCKGTLEFWRNYCGSCTSACKGLGWMDSARKGMNVDLDLVLTFYQMPLFYHELEVVLYRVGVCVGGGLKLWIDSSPLQKGNVLHGMNFSVIATVIYSILIVFSQSNISKVRTR